MYWTRKRGDTTNEPVKIDPEFQSLIPPLTADEFKQLEENCKRDGILDSLKVWNGILIDGHNRHRISEKWDLNYQVEEMEFPDRDSVIQWIITNQFGRRNISTYDRSILALKLKPMIAEKARKQQVRKSVSQKSVEQKPIDTQKELAKVAGVSHDTINKVETIEASNDNRLKQAVRSGEISIHRAYLSVKDKDRRRNEMTARANLERAEERHERYQNSTTVSIDDARQEKEDIAKIAKDRIGKIRNSLKGILLIGATMQGGDADFSIIHKSGVKTDSLRNDITSAITVLNRILKEMER